MNWAILVFGGFVAFVALAYVAGRAVALGYFRSKADYERKQLLNFKGDKKDAKGQ